MRQEQKGCDTMPLEIVRQDITNMAVDAVFRSAKVEDGVLVWQDGAIDISAEEVYQRSCDCPEQSSSIA